VFVPDKSSQPRQLLVCKAGAYLNEAPFSCSTLGLGPVLAHKHELG